jgi:hypothetical protein
MTVMAAATYGLARYARGTTSTAKASRSCCCSPEGPPDDKPVVEAIAVADSGVGDKLARVRVADYLMDIDGDAAVGSSANPWGSTVLEIASNCLFQ